MNIAQAKEVSLVDVLRLLGYIVIQTKRNGTELWYKSPFREEKTPSFHINTNRNIWYDFGLGEGGNIIDFVIAYENTDVSGALKFLENVWGRGVGSIPKNKTPILSVPPTKQLITFEHIASDFSYPTKSYLSSRGIAWQEAQRFVEEVHFKVREKSQFALGMKNQSDGWELRNAIFKSCIGVKDISIWQEEESPLKSLTIFEGMFDFLSLFACKNPIAIQGTVIVLHSTALFGKFKDYLAQHNFKGNVFTFLDNDEAGATFFRKLKSITSLTLVPQNDQYKTHNDLNAWWIEHLNAQRKNRPS